jgi:hypothetical protein
MVFCHRKVYNIEVLLHFVGIVIQEINILLLIFWEIGKNGYCHSRGLSHHEP